MSRQRVLIGMQLAASLVLAGLGHYYMSALRSVYPIDGWLFYAAAVFLLRQVWRGVRREPEPAGAGLRAALRSARNLIGEALRTLKAALSGWPSLRTWVMMVVALNGLAALAAIFMPQADDLWLGAWLISVVSGGALAITRSTWWRHSTAPRLTTESILEAEPTLPGVNAKTATRLRPNPIGLLVSFGLLIAGQLAMTTTRPTGGGHALPILSPVAEALRLDLAIDPTPVVAGWLLSVIGAIGLAAVTRRRLLSDAPPFQLQSPPVSRPRLDAGWSMVALVGLAIWFLAVRNIATEATGWSGVTSWLIGLALITASWWHVDRARGVRWAIAFDRVEAVALGAALIAALIALAYQLGAIPATLWGDEGAYFTLARDISRHTLTPDFFGLGTYSLPMAGSIYQAVWIELFGENVTAWRLASVLAVWAALPPLYFLARATLGRRAAWLSLAFMTVSPYVLTYARLGYTSALSVAPVAMAAALMWAAVRRDSRLAAFGAGAAAGLGWVLQPSARLAFLLLVAWLAWLLIARAVRARAIFWQGAVLTLGVVAVAAPAVAYGVLRAPEAYAGEQVEAAFNNVFYARDLYPDDQLYAAAGPIRVGDQELFYEPSIYVSLLTRGTLRTALSFHTPSLARENYLTDGLAAPFGVLYLIGLGWCLGKLREPGYALWAGWLALGAFTLSALSTFPPRAALMFPVTPALAALSALGLVLVVEVTAGFIGTVPPRVKMAALSALAGVLAIFGLRAYFVEVPQRFPPDLEQAMFWQAQQQGPETDVTLIASAGVADDFAPWGIREFDLGVTYHQIKLDELEAADWAALCPRECSFFFGAAEIDRVWPVLTQAYGMADAVAYHDASGSTQFYRFDRP